MTELLIKNYRMSAMNRKHLIQRIEQLDCISRDYVVDVREFKVKRSNPQNDRMWQYFTDLAVYLGYEKREVEFVKEFVTLDVWPEIVKLPDGEIKKMPPRTSKMDTKTHGEMMEAVERKCVEWGFYWVEKYS